MRTLVANHLAAQVQAGRTPYIYMVFTSTTGATTYDFSTNSGAYGNRLLLIDDTELPYARNTFIMLQNHDRVIPDLTGYWTEIGYGDTYGGSNYYQKTARVWVKKQQTISKMGRVYTVLTCGGLWEFFGEQQVLIGYPPLYQDEYLTLYGTYTVLESMQALMSHLINRILDNYQSIQGIENLNTSATSPQDGILTTYKPNLQINENTFESIASVMWALINMTKCVIRLKASNVIDVIFPQDTDAVDKTFYSYQQPYFYEYKKIDNITIPNRVIVHGKVDPLLDWSESNMVTGTTATETTQINKYTEVKEIHLCPNLNTVADCTTRAEVILDREKHHDVTGELFIPHDAALELYDYITITDSRGT